MSIELPSPDQSVIARRLDIVRDLQALAGSDAVIADEDGRRAFETDALTAYRCMPLAVVLPSTTETVSKILKYCKANGDQGHGPRRRHVAVWRFAAVRRRDRPRRLQDEQGSRDRSREPLRARAVGHHQSRHLQCGLRRRLFLRTRSFEPGRLHARRQSRHEFRRRPLLEVWRHHQQCARRQDRAHGRRDRRYRRLASRCRRL